MNQKNYLNLLFIVTAIYFILAIIGLVFSPKGEYFPFFTWALYKSAPQDILKFDILLNEKSESFLENKEINISKTQRIFMLKGIGYCKTDQCKQKFTETISKYIDINKCAILISIKNNTDIDTIGYLNHNTFSSKNCYNEY